MNRPPLPLVVVAALLAAGVGAGELLRPGGVDRPDPDTVPVVGAGVVCPDVRQVPGVLRTTVAAGVTGGGEVTGGAAIGGGAVVDGAVTAQPLADGEDAGDAGPPAPGVLPLEEPGAAVAELAADLTDVGYAVQATGALAPGLTALQTTTAGAGAERGLATLRCPPARTETWLVGGGATVGESSVLVLANPEPVPAVVDVTAYTGEGRGDDRAGRGITVPALGRTLVPLDTLAPDRSRLALRVVAERGRVAAALRHTRFDGAVPRGVEWAAGVAAPATEVVVPGLPAGPGARRLWVTNPGETEVVVEVEVTTGDGQFVPDGLAALPVPAGSTVAAELTEVLAATPAAARVTATGGPVLAAGFAEDAGEGDVRDLAYSAAAPPVDGPALLPDVPVDGIAETVLLLSALSGDAVVELVAVAQVGAPSLPVPPRRVEVPGGRTVAVPVSGLVPAELRGRVAVQVVPDEVGSPVHVGVVHRLRPPEGPLLTAFPLAAAAPPVERPPVLRDPAAGTGSR